MLGIDKTAYTFTGQGSQRVGMWGGLECSRRAQEIFQTADEITGFPLSRLCREGPLEELTRTRNAQPAIVAHSLAVLAVAEELHPELLNNPPKYVLGHSVGEFSALAAAGVITSRQAIYLVRQRGLLMEQFGGEGSMIALIGFEDQQQVFEICQSTGTEPANFNGPSQTVISGSIIALEEAMKLAKEKKIKARALQVSRPFHSSLMRPVKQAFEEEVAWMASQEPFKDPIVPVVLNTTAKPSESGAEIQREIVEQIAKPVLWRQSVEWVLGQGVNRFVEFGPASVLTGLLGKINESAMGTCIKDYESAVNYSYARAS